MSALSPAIFENLCSKKSAEYLLNCHIAQKRALIADQAFADIGFDLDNFIEILRDRRWHNDEEIKFYSDNRVGPSHEIWSQAIRSNGSLGLDTILHLKASKTSIYVKRLELMHQGLRELAAKIATTGYFDVTLSAMYSPAGALSTPNHIDTCDVLAIQLHGQKNWTVDSQARAQNAHPGQIEAKPDNFDFIDSSEFTTKKGDALFIPRGFLHNAMANDEDSLHLVIGLLPLTWFDVLSDMVQEYCDSEPAFRASIFDQELDLKSEKSAKGKDVLFKRFADPDELSAASKRVLRKRAQRHAIASFGQLFAKSIENYDKID